MARQDRQTIVRYPDDEGTIVAKIAGRNLLIPDEVHEYSGFKFIQVPNASSLTDKTVDRSALSAEELELINQIDYREQ